MRSRVAIGRHNCRHRQVVRPRSVGPLDPGEVARRRVDGPGDVGADAYP
jgi:hypothetical protein